MKKALAFFFALFAATMVTACGEPQSNVEKINQQVKSKIYALNADERVMAEINAKNFFNKEFPSINGTFKQGKFIDCRPSDSNFNGLVTCNGFLPSQQQEIMEPMVRYCGYRADLVGCSNEDTVKS